MGNKLKVVLSGIYYPFAILSYFRRALEHRTDVELFTVGAFTGQYIPWAGGLTIPMKYPNVIDLPLPAQMTSPSWEQISSTLPWHPDISISVDAGFHFSTKPDATYTVVATDPHVLGGWYDKVRPISDYFFNMQSSYMKEGDHFIPYGFDPFCHYPETMEKEYDCAIVGLHYPQRDEWVSRLRALGVKVNYRIGDIFDEYRHENNKAWIGLNWSSEKDVTARVFEICAMRMVPVLNRLPGLDLLGFEDGRHYLGFSSMEEAVEKVMWAKTHRPQAEQIALEAYRFVHSKGFTYDTNVQTILQKTGLLLCN